LKQILGCLHSDIEFEIIRAMPNPVLTIVIPCFNEESNIAQVIHRFDEAALKLPSFEILFVDDGSKDETVAQILKYKGTSRAYDISLLKLSRNFGHQLALLAGMRNSVGQACVTIDADMQDPPEVISEMVRQWQNGYDVVLGQRSDRIKDTLFKRATAAIFYKFMKVFARGDFPANVGDFRLVSHKVVEVLKSLPEQSPYWRGIVVWVGFKRTFVSYARAERFSGETKYPFLKMVAFGVDALFSFSKKPLLFVVYSGFLICFMGLLLMSIYIYLKLTGYALVPGWASLVSLITFIGGFQIVCMGVIGQYIGCIYEQVLGRPQVLYDIAETITSSTAPK
jgi:glycosyltransferase involved in cell wall biosynthesis